MPALPGEASRLDIDCNGPYVGPAERECVPHALWVCVCVGCVSAASADLFPRLFFFFPEFVAPEKKKHRACVELCFPGCFPCSLPGTLFSLKLY